MGGLDFDSSSRMFLDQSSWLDGQLSNIEGAERSRNYATVHTENGYISQKSYECNFVAERWGGGISSLKALKVTSIKIFVK